MHISIMAHMKPKDTTTFGGRVNWALEHSGKNVLSISQKIGCSHVALGNWKNNKVDSAAIRADMLMRFADETGTQWRWLLTGEGKAVVTPSISESPLMQRVSQALCVMEEYAPYNVEKAVQMLEATANMAPKPPEAN